ncbi:MAG: DMT family transporter, partial [Nakamurella sp.]
MAILAALASALCFAIAAALQQREAGLVVSSGVADPRVLFRLARRPIWLAGLGADGLSVALHVLALSQGSIAVVQPLGVTGLLFAIPLVAVLRRQRVPLRDIIAAMVVLAGLGVLLQLAPHTTQAAAMGSRMIIIAVPVVALVFAAVMLGLAHARPGRARALLLAVAAGTLFGSVAVLVRALLLMMGRPHQGRG